MPEREPSESNITFRYKKKGDILARTIGRVGSLWQNIQLLTPSSSFRDPTEEDVERLKEMFKDVKWKGQIEVNVNHSPFFNQLKRLFSSERRTNFFVRATAGMVSTLYYSILAHFIRADYYNPYTESSSIYHTNPDVQAQQLGRAKFFDQGEFSTFNSFFYSLPIARTQREWNASKIVMEHLKTEEERQRARKVLEPWLGLYVGRDAGIVAGWLLKDVPLGPALHLPWSVPLGIIPNKIPFFAPFIPTIGAIIGHIHARASRRNIFFNPDKKVDVQPTVQPQPAVVPVAA